MSKEPEELKEDKGGQEGGVLGSPGEGSVLRYLPLPRAQEPLAMEDWLTGVCTFLPIM